MAKGAKQPAAEVKQEEAHKLDADAEGETEVSSSDESDADASGEDDDDPDAQAEAVARLLGDALWADIAKAYETTPPVPVDAAQPHVPSDAERAVLEGIQAVLAHVVGDSGAMEGFWSTSMPSVGGSVLDLLTSSLRGGRFPVAHAESLATSIESLLSGPFFSAVGEQVIGKRKREDDEDAEVEVE